MQKNCVFRTQSHNRTTLYEILYTMKKSVQRNPTLWTPLNAAIYNNADTLLNPEYHLHRLTCTYTYKQTPQNVDTSLIHEADTWFDPNGIIAHTNSPLLWIVWQLNKQQEELEPNHSATSMLEQLSV